MRKIRSFMLSIVALMVAMTGFAYIPADVGPPVTESAALFKKEVVSVTPAVMVINQQIDLEATDVGIPSLSYDVIDKNYEATEAKGVTVTSSIDERIRPGNTDNYFNKTDPGKSNSLAFIDRHRRMRDNS
ncbi:MAG: hypothetical protein KA290_14825 [Chitinophagaceae bacterium]|nr:hypothetical protein [Chitinophagaceae bacterium]